MNMRGLNLTMPHKIRIIPLLDRLTQAAQIIGAVNTVINDDGVWVGENTDGKGFVLAMELAEINREEGFDEGLLPGLGRNHVVSFRFRRSGQSCRNTHILQWSGRYESSGDR